jgi:hypothetical protein
MTIVVMLTFVMPSVIMTNVIALQRRQAGDYETIFLQPGINSTKLFFPFSVDDRHKLDRLSLFSLVRCLQGLVTPA